jgi:hypothetical protein
MSLDFQQVRQQINEMGEASTKFLDQIEQRRAAAFQILDQWTDTPNELRSHAEEAIRLNSNLRTALPTEEPLRTAIDPAPLTEAITILAADGSQINPDRHAAVDYCLVNVGAIQMQLGSATRPETMVQSRLLHNDDLFLRSGRLTERVVALMRDLRERQLLSELAQKIDGPVITLTDGPLELWSIPDGDGNRKLFEEHFEEYLQALKDLHATGASTAGYIDKPGSDLLVRLLEIGHLPQSDLKQAGQDYRPFRGLVDTAIFAELLAPGQRSAIFEIYSSNAKKYPGELALHFFYLQVGLTPGRQPLLARVEIPRWVAEDAGMVADLHAVLVQQCQILATRFPYLLHRSHEVAVVTMDEKRQVEQMIAMELRRRGYEPGVESAKQQTKNAAG